MDRVQASTFTESACQALNSSRLLSRALGRQAEWHSFGERCPLNVPDGPDLLLRVSRSLHVKLAGGQNVGLDVLTQGLTYSGTLEGFPDARSNDWLIQHIIGKAQ